MVLLGYLIILILILLLNQGGHNQGNDNQIQFGDFKNITGNKLINK
jgi:hypothetical protein